MRRVFIVITLLVAAGNVWAADRGGQAARLGRVAAPRLCRIEVLHSEYLPWARLASNNLRVRLLITPPDAQPYVADFAQMVPWQSPPPRIGQAYRIPCADLNAHTTGF